MPDKLTLELRVRLVVSVDIMAEVNVMRSPCARAGYDFVTLCSNLLRLHKVTVLYHHSRHNLNHASSKKPTFPRLLRLAGRQRFVIHQALNSRRLPALVQKSEFEPTFASDVILDAKVCRDMMGL
jgi:hypothetical protein